MAGKKKFFAIVGDVSWVLYEVGIACLSGQKKRGSAMVLVGGNCEVSLLDIFFIL